MSDSRRVQLVDALRGLALFMIVLIHFIEHFELFQDPDFNYFFSAKTDSIVFEMVFFFISGKAYSIFALMFGFSFYIQMHRKEINGVDFTNTFIWRLIILLIMGFVHSLVYKGDILQIYALMGLFLVLFYKIETNKLFFIAILFAMQIPSIYNVIVGFINSKLIVDPSFGGDYWQRGNEIYATGSFWEVVKFNLWQGKLNSWGWTIGSGRYLQLFALFIFGFVLGRIKFFERVNTYKALIQVTAIISLVAGIFLYFLLLNLNTFSQSPEQIKALEILIKSQYNLAFTVLIISLFILAYIKNNTNLIMNSLAIYGRMSLTNYVSQAVIGVILFYEFGFGLSHYLGSTWSLIFGFVFFIFQVEFSKVWLKHYYYGPLEWIWRTLTYKTTDVRMRKKKSKSVNEN